VFCLFLTLIAKCDEEVAKEKRCYDKYKYRIDSDYGRYCTNDYKIKQGHILFIDEISKTKRILQRYELTEFIEYEGIKK
jgi:hypothetical protein